MLHGLRTIAAACDAFPDVAARIAGIHLEGPFLSERDGYRGAHPVASIRDPDWELFQEFQAAASGRIVLITLAPERVGSLEFIRRATGMGVVVALGHTAADGATIHAAAQAGARLSTHLGNGIASPLPRHPNPIWEQAGLDQLSATFIADGHHLDLATLRVLARAKGRRGRSWSATPVRSPACHPAIMASGPSIHRARSWWPERPIWPARTKGWKSVCATCWRRPAGPWIKASPPSPPTPRILLDQRPPRLAAGEPAEPRPVAANRGLGPSTGRLLY